MELMPIFVHGRTQKGLHSICLKKGGQSEYDVLLDRLTDIGYIRRYCKDNLNYLNSDLFGRISLEDVIGEIRKDVWRMMDVVKNASALQHTNHNMLETIFRPLHNLDATAKALQAHKYKPGRRSKIRLYAIRITEDIFVVTGGVIKVTQTMKDHPDTRTELMKIERIKTWLKETGVCDGDSITYYYEEQE